MKNWFRLNVMQFHVVLVTLFGVLVVSLGTPIAKAEQPAGEVYMISREAYDRQQPRTFSRELELNSRSLKFKIHRKFNANNEFEYAVGMVEERALLADTETIVLFGRDVDLDEKPDLWFVPMGEGDLQLVVKPSQKEDGWDVLPEILKTRANLEIRSSFGLAASSVYNALFFTPYRQHSFFEKIMSEEMDILDLEGRLEILQSRGSSPKELLIYYEIASKGWNSILDRMDSEIYKEMTLSVVDGLTIYAAPKVIGAVGKTMAPVRKFILTKVAPQIARGFAWATEREAAQAMAGFFERYRTGLVSTSKAFLTRFNRLTGKVLPRSAGVIGNAASRLAAWSVQKQTNVAIRALNSKKVVEKLAWKSVDTVLKVAKAGGGQWKYIAQTQTMQIIAEYLQRRQDLLYGPPLIVKQNIHEMGQNVGYMTAETFLQASISSSSSNLTKRMTLCGLVSFNNSMAFSLALDGAPNPARQGLDTRWEVVVGNLQTQLDIEALRLFEEVAAKSNQPRLKVLGYAIALVDQFVGYNLYAKATNTLDANGEPQAKKPKLMLLPIVQENE